MSEIYQFLRSAEAWIYLLLGLSAMIPFRWLVQGINDYRSSLFGMERELAKRKINQAVGFLILLGLLAGSVFGFVTFIGTTPLAATALPTPTIDLSATASPAAVFSGSSPAANPAGVASNSGCIANQIEWLFPAGGEEISGRVVLKGTVRIDNFGFYKYEYSQNGSNWLTIQAGTGVVTSGELGTWDTTLLVPGDYQLRLIVTDNQGNELPACAVGVRVVPE